MLAAPGVKKPYGHNPVSTGGFVMDADKGELPVANETMCCGAYQSSPIIATAGGWAFLSGFVNLILHIALLVITGVVCAGYLPPHAKDDTTGVRIDDDNVNYTPQGTKDYVRGWVITAIVMECIVVVLTIGYYGFKKQAMAWPIFYHITLALQMITVVCYMLLNAWLAIAPTADKAIRETWADSWIVCGLYVSVATLAGFIATPISGNYYLIASE